MGDSDDDVVFVREVIEPADWKSVCRRQAGPVQQPPQAQPRGEQDIEHRSGEAVQLPHFATRFSAEPPEAQVGTGWAASSRHKPEVIDLTADVDDEGVAHVDDSARTPENVIQTPATLDNAAQRDLYDRLSNYYRTWSQMIWRIDLAPELLDDLIHTVRMYYLRETELNAELSKRYGVDLTTPPPQHHQKSSTFAAQTDGVYDVDDSAEAEITRILTCHSHADVLRLPMGTARKAVLQRYRSLALQVHPDKQSNEGKATECAKQAFQKLVEARDFFLAGIA